MPFEMLVDMRVDYPDRNARFEVVYNLLSLRHNQRVRIRLSVDEDTPVASVMSIYPSASWFERECWDMYGIFSRGIRICELLTDYGFDGHPFVRISRWLCGSSLRR